MAASFLVIDYSIVWFICSRRYHSSREWYRHRRSHDIGDHRYYGWVVHEPGTGVHVGVADVSRCFHVLNQYRSLPFHCIGQFIYEEML